MPYKEKPIQKKYFTIGEVADELNCATSAIRFLQTEFKIQVKRDSKGNRQFTKETKQLIANAYIATRHMHIETVKISRIWKDQVKLQQVLSLLFVSGTQQKAAENLQNNIKTYY